VRRAATAAASLLSISAVEPAWCLAGTSDINTELQKTSGDHSGCNLARHLSLAHILLSVCAEREKDHGAEQNWRPGKERSIRYGCLTRREDELGLTMMDRLVLRHL
jgi:hypothetical protein